MGVGKLHIMYRASRGQSAEETHIACVAFYHKVVDKFSIAVEVSGVACAGVLVATYRCPLHACQVYVFFQYDVLVKYICIRNDFLCPSLQAFSVVDVVYTVYHFISLCRFELAGDYGA